jgi:creatinine amidohydrolase
MPVHLLASLPWTAVRDLAGDRTIAILPTGALEAHGPHLPLATDIVIADAMARAGAGRLSARGLQVLLLPAMPFAAAPFAAGFAGTLDVPAEAVTALVVGIAVSLGGRGVRITAIANGHHDPAHVAALRAAEARVNGGGVNRLVFPDLTRRRWAERLTEEFRSGTCHAGRYEGSIVLAERAAWVRTDLMGQLAPNPRSLVEAIREGRRTFEDAGGPNAYFGFPSEASAEEGRRTVDVLGAILEEAVLEVMGAGPG